MRRVTITMPEATFERVRATVERGAASSVSAYLSTLADEHTREQDVLRVVDALDAEHSPRTNRTWRGRARCFAETGSARRRGPDRA